MRLLVTWLYSLARSRRNPLSAPLVITRRVVAVSERVATRSRSNRVKYGFDEAEQRVSDNVGCDGAYYRIELRPAFNNTRHSPPLDRTLDSSPQSRPARSHFSYSLHPFSVPLCPRSCKRITIILFTTLQLRCLLPFFMILSNFLRYNVTRSSACKEIHYLQL